MVRAAGTGSCDLELHSLGLLDNTTCKECRSYLLFGSEAVRFQPPFFGCAIQAYVNTHLSLPALNYFRVPKGKWASIPLAFEGCPSSLHLSWIFLWSPGRHLWLTPLSLVPETSFRRSLDLGLETPFSNQDPHFLPSSGITPHGRPVPAA